MLLRLILFVPFLWHLMCLLNAYGSTFHHISISYIFWLHQPPPKTNHILTFKLTFQKSCLWASVKENNEYWTHKSKFDNLFSKTSISLCLYHMIMTYIYEKLCVETQLKDDNLHFSGQEIFSLLSVLKQFVWNLAKILQNATFY